ncbi:DUF222 domain-containing protein, partial [Mycobacterium sp. E740]|uniref:DUF222 domain-containing protein n=1 Tax=Mycobacterium sp. E740 TaxID=1834149 RepID=UPI000B33CF8D
MFEAVGDADLLEVMGEAQRAERVAVARKVIAAGRFGLRRFAAMGNTHASWCIDDWDVIASEVAAELGVSRGRASAMISYGCTLIEQLPRLAEVFGGGRVDLRVIRIIDYRTALVVDEQAMAVIDERLARAAPGWNKLSDARIAQLVDWMVLDVDPQALRVAHKRDEDRHLEISTEGYGTAEVWGRLHATVGAALDEKLAQLAGTVCGDDPRTVRQRRADAVEALLAGASKMACRCDTERCAAGDRPAATAVVIHVIAQDATLAGKTNTPGYAPGIGVLPAALVREMAATATLKPLHIPT